MARVEDFLKNSLGIAGLNTTQVHIDHSSVTPSALAQIEDGEEVMRKMVDLVNEAGKSLQAA